MEYYAIFIFDLISQHNACYTKFRATNNAYSWPGSLYIGLRGGIQTSECDQSCCLLNRDLCFVIYYFSLFVVQ